MAALTINDIDSDGLDYSGALAAAAAGGDTIKEDGLERTFLAVDNAGGSSIDVTITAQDTTVNAPGVGEVSVSDIVVSVPAGADRLIGPFPSAFIDASGNVAVGYSDDTSVTVAALRLKKAT
jgi:hypothetical protein